MNAVHGSQMMCLGTQMGNKLQWIISIFTLSVSIQWPFRGRHFLHFSASKTRMVMAVFQFFYLGGNKRLEKIFGVPWPRNFLTPEETSWVDRARAGHFWWTILHLFRFSHLGRPIQFRDFSAYGWYIPITGIHGKLHVKSMNIPIPLNPNQ